MPNFSQQSLEKLKTCHIDLQTLFGTVIQYYNCTILVGHRDQADQEAAFAAGKTQLHYPDSKHNSVPSMAVDAMPDVNGLIDWHDSVDIAYFSGYVMATAQQLYLNGKMTHKLRYGGCWKMDNDLKDNHFADMDHFELVAP